jgi:hypothetical protein
MRPNVDGADSAVRKVIDEDTDDPALYRRRGVIHIRYMLTFEKTHIFNLLVVLYFSILLH